MSVVGRFDVPGPAAPGYIAGEVIADQKLVMRVTWPWSKNVSKVSVYLDGQGTGIGDQVVRAIIYDAVTNALAAVSDEVVVRKGQAAGWVDFPFSALKGNLALTPGDYFVGLHTGLQTNTIRMSGSGPSGGGGKFNVDTYADGPAATFGAANAVTWNFALVVTAFEPYLPPDETDIYYSRLPYYDAGAALRTAGRGVAAPRLADAGWHDTFIDPETGANALVRAGGVFEDLLGERIRVTTQSPVDRRGVIAYVHNLADEDIFDWDLSLTRHLFSQLSLLAKETVPVLVEVLG